MHVGGGKDSKAQVYEVPALFEIQIPIFSLNSELSSVTFTPQGSSEGKVEEAQSTARHFPTTARTLHGPLTAGLQDGIIPHWPPSSPLYGDRCLPR